MQRSWDTLRELLLRIEEQRPDQALGPADFDSGRSHEIYDHVRLLQEAGLVQASVMNSLGAGSGDFRIFRLTWAGHEILDGLRNNEVWAGVKTSFESAGLGLQSDLVVEASRAHSRELMLGRQF